MENIKFITGSEKKFADFISGLGEKDKIAILAHLDNDGITSAVIASKILGKIEHLQFFEHKKGMLIPVISEMKKKKINKIIMLDLSTDDIADHIKEMEKFAEILIIDHHVFRTDLNSDKTIMLKSPSDFPAAFMCYHLFSKIQKVEGWIAALGIAGDRVDKYHDKNVDEVFDDFRLGESPGHGYFWKYVISLNYAWIYYSSLEKDVREIYEIIMKAKNLDELDIFDKYSDEVRKEFDSRLIEFDDKKEEFSDMYFYYYKPKYSITSMLSNALSSRSRDKTYVIVADFKNMLRISMRRQDKKMDCVRLLQDSIAGIPNSTAGGHPAAAGANIPVEYLDKFKETLFRIYRNMRI